MNVGVLFSGGKDSCYALWLAQKTGKEISCLISVQSKNLESYMFHTPNISWTQKQASAMGVPLIVQETTGKKDREISDLKKAIKKAVREFGIEGVVCGAIESVYQAQRVQKVCSDLDLWCFSPLWKSDPFEYLLELIRTGFRVIVVGVAAYPLGKEWLGREIDSKSVEELERLYNEHGISPIGEGGEFETFVVDGPNFKKRVNILGSRTSYREYRGFYNIKKIELIDK